MQGHDVTEAHRLSEELIHQIEHDPLTGLLNRRALDRLSHRINKEAGAHVLMYMDLDHLKIINDRCGHHAGDALIVQVADVLKSFVRHHKDHLVRIGGDAFVFVRNCCDEQTGFELANQLRNTIQALIFRWKNRRHSITISIGLVSFGTSNEIDFSGALSLADSACFLAKESGRNRVRVSRNDDEEVHQQQLDMDWVSRIKEAIADDRIVLWGQQIISLHEAADGSRVEVLARLKEINGTLVAPGAFITAAERFGVVEQLDFHIVEKVFKYIEDLSYEHVDSSFFINLSGATLGTQDFVQKIQAIAAQYPRVKPQRICFEVTETSAITNISLTAQAMRTLAALGFTFALDDFGSGMSSFRYLEKLPVSYLKIDGEFIRNMDTHIAGEAIVEAVAKVARTMGIMTVAEHVEKLNQLPILHVLGVDLCQGFATHIPESLNTLFSTK